MGHAPELPKSVFPFLDATPSEEVHELSKGVPQSQRIYATDGVSPTLRAHGTGGPDSVRVSLAEEHVRRLTPVECERLQGFPDGHTEGVSDTARYKQCGNAMTVNVVEAVAYRLLEGWE